MHTTTPPLSHTPPYQHIMCTQELIWCSCGHGELLPIVKCATAHSTGHCWTVIHGDHSIVIQMKCTYCNMGLQEHMPLPPAKPEGELARTIESKAGTGTLDPSLEVKPAETVDLEESSFEPTEPPWDLDDVLNPDFLDFDLNSELWQYQ